jgi:hypothetical protein
MTTPPSPDDENTMDYFLGKRPSGATTDSKLDLGTIVRDVDELMVLNDEAHHVHDPQMAWFKSIQETFTNRRSKRAGVGVTGGRDRHAQEHNNGAIFVPDGGRLSPGGGHRPERGQAPGAGPMPPAGPDWWSARAPNTPSATPIYRPGGDRNGARPPPNTPKSWARRPSSL